MTQRIIDRIFYVLGLLALVFCVWWICRSCEHQSKRKAEQISDSLLYWKNQTEFYEFKADSAEKQYLASDSLLRAAISAAQRDSFRTGFRESLRKSLAR